MTKKLDRGSFERPGIPEYVMRMTAAQLGALHEGLDWRRVMVDASSSSRELPVGGAFCC